MLRELLLIQTLLIHGCWSVNCPSDVCDCLVEEVRKSLFPNQLCPTNMLNAIGLHDRNLSILRAALVGSRREVRMSCNNNQEQGYVPVFQHFNDPISKIILNGIQLTQIGNNTFKALSVVRELYLNDNYITRIDTRAFAHIDHSIEILDLQHNRLSSLRFLTTHDFRRLRELLLRDNQLENLSIDTFAYLPSLNNLNLDENRLSGSLEFLQQPSLKALTYLNLDANRLDAIEPDDFTNLTNLASLLVNRNQLTDLDFLLHPIFRRLQGFSAANNQIDRASLDHFEGKRLLRWIDLSGNQLTEANFTSSCSLVNLEEIYLSSNSITQLPEDAFRATSSLTIFIIHNNGLTTLPRCALTKFYERMDTFDISNNPLNCGCELAWLKQPHTILTERQSQCANIEFSDTASFETQECTTPKLCAEHTDACTKSNGFIYSNLFEKLSAEYRHSTTLAPINSSPNPLTSQFLVILSGITCLLL